MLLATLATAVAGVAATTLATGAASAVLAGTLAASSWGPGAGQAGTRGSRSWWRRGGSATARADAQAARDAAAHAFYELDTALRDVAISVETVTAVDDSPEGRRAATRFQAERRRVDEVSAAYIAVVDRHDLEAEELTADRAATARRELEEVRARLEAAHEDLDRYHTSIEPLMERAATSLSRLAPAVERARSGLRAATEALDAVRAAGIRAEALAARLAALGPELTRLGEGARVHGVTDTLRRADEVARAAERIRGELVRLPEQRAELVRRLASLRTRRQAVETKAERVAPALSELRRAFSLPCWEDLQDVPGRIPGLLKAADDRLAEGETALREQHWADATARLAAARATLGDADELIASVRDRLTELTDVRRDPRAHLERARFTVRDAQRLAMAGRSVPDPRHAEPLDAAVARLDRAEAGLTGRHPDYWHFLTELAAVRRTAADVVRRIREERGGRAG
ncbi:hypothetical protein [Allostreptomyces psammosilenae]|uniref:Chromosome segregation ATPase n=1 Tax=Allostreptomyces psammosilenae TaxID=1892865 RepID=A0A853A1D9_9ACTN|nr:hypothetical protein [Allostreptomyces psammosilenae]NYI06734.1 chromosome segregation ATPase [Allostreptomyces psammosilenae]